MIDCTYMADDPHGLRELIERKGLTLAQFARALGATSQGVNNWIARGLPGSKVFLAADILGMSVDDLRPYVSEGRKSDSEIDAEIRRFKALYPQLDPARKAKFLAWARAQSDK